MADSSHSADVLRLRFEETLRRVLNKAEDFHIEDAPDRSDGFMQCALGKSNNLHVEYSVYPENREQRIYRSIEDVPFEIAVELFASYASGQSDWEKRIEWEDWTEEYNKGPGFFDRLKTIIFWFVVIVFIGGSIYGLIAD